MAGTLLAPLCTDYLSPCSPTHQNVISKVFKFKDASCCFLGMLPPCAKWPKFCMETIFFQGGSVSFLSVYHVFSVLCRYESNLWVLVGTCRTLLKCNSLQLLSALWMNFKTIQWVSGRLLLEQNTQFIIKITQTGCWKPWFRFLNGFYDVSLPVSEN